MTETTKMAGNKKHTERPQSAIRNLKQDKRTANQKQQVKKTRTGGVERDNKQLETVESEEEEEEEEEEDEEEEKKRR